MQVLLHLFDFHLKLRTNILYLLQECLIDEFTNEMRKITLSHALIHIDKANTSKFNKLVLTELKGRDWIYIIAKSANIFSDVIYNTNARC